MKIYFFVLSVLMFIFWLFPSSSQAQSCEELGWRLSIQCYTFKNFTFIETLEKAEQLGVKCIEGYRTQKIGGGYEGTTHYSSDAETIKIIKKLLADKGIKMVSYGVVRAEDQSEWQQIFDFAKEMDLEFLTVEPKAEQFSYLDEMAKKYNIKLAIHNHPKPTYYWSPDVVLKNIEGKSNQIGACADVGHWVRSGLDPVECLQKLKGNIISLHFKDLNKQDIEAHDVPWGTGISNVPAMLKEMKLQGFKGVFTIEYEYNWDNSVPEIAESIANFKKIVREL